MLRGDNNASYIFFVALIFFHVGCVSLFKFCSFTIRFYASYSFLNRVLYGYKFLRTHSHRALFFCLGTNTGDRSVYFCHFLCFFYIPERLSEVNNTAGKPWYRRAFPFTLAELLTLEPLLYAANPVVLLRVNKISMERLSDVLLTHVVLIVAIFLVLQQQINITKYIFLLLQSEV